MVTALEFYNKLKEEFSFLDVEKRIPDDPIRLPDSQIQILNRLFHSWTEHISKEMQKSLLVDVLCKPDIENGKVYEALIYAWLEKHHIHYTPQVHIEQSNCFKASTKGYDADGIIIENNVIFDVKQFGLTLPHIEILRRKVQDKIPEDYRLTIGGGMNISAKELQSNFLEKIDELIDSIMNEKQKVYTDYIYHDPKYGMEFRLWNKKNPSMPWTISQFDQYEWAENNQFYFMYHASQFCINFPYILFCPYDEQLVPLFSCDNGKVARSALRTLCRRIFMNLTKMDQRKINEFDGKARTDISVATAAKKISAIAFIDVSEDFNYQNSHIFVFLNPNADYKIPGYQVQSVFRNAGAYIDDFEHDNY